MDVKLAIDLCERAMIPEHKTKISKITAEDAAESERSVQILLTPEESIQVFAYLKVVLENRGA